ncbi:MAG: right-handed parallel beta-helix repeat-containing protein [Planctomycetota bacterium]|nr:right-handed parallel beta-helix repeat-containing protein [Planctomycetota bacterium]
MRQTTLCLCFALCAFCAASAENASKPIGEPVLEPPTLHCLGVYWIIRGDENKNAQIDVEYRKQGDVEWKKGPPLFRVEKGAHKAEKHGTKLDVPGDAWLFAGSIFVLAPDTAYELKLKLNDPDGGRTEKTLAARTIAEPAAPAGAPTYHVVPGSGGGKGTQGEPYHGLDAAQAAARAGDVFLLHAGVYEGTFTAKKSGEPGRPVIWRGAGDGEAIIDGQGKAAKRPGRGISAGDVHDVWFEKLTIRNADYAIVGHRSARLVIRRCHMHGVDYGLTCTNNDNDGVRDFFISDNVIEGPCTWPRSKGIENPRGIQVTGMGHVVCYNRIRGFSDALDTFPSPRCAAIDFHNNEISECTDDGIEMDYSERNTRCFSNRFTNVFQGISVQPVYGGPVYIFRNVLYNVCVEVFKMHNSPSGALMVHNTSVKKDMPLVLMTGEKVRNCVYRNNLFIGTTANYAYESTAPMEGCDFDYDGFGGGPWRTFLKWNGIRYATVDEARAKAPVYKHALLVDAATLFASGVKPPTDEKSQCDISVNDLRLKAGSGALDAGAVLPGFNDDFAGKAPDLGAYEFGGELPHYGPRPEKK